MKAISAVTFLLLIFLGCTPKISTSLKEIQELNYSNGWEKVNSYPIKHGRSDDLHFFDEMTGFVINSAGYLSYTEDGGETWEVMHQNEGTFFRCITFKNRQEGWLGNIGRDEPLLHSRDSIALYKTKDGGVSWSPVEFIGPTPKGLCGLQKVNEDVIVGCGRVRGPSYFVKTVDGGSTWYSQNLDHVAGSLIAAHFFDQNRGLLIGGTTRDKENCRSMVLETLDGGTSWDTIYLSKQIGEYPWKFSFPTKEKGFISIQRNVKNGSFYHLQTIDGGKTWKEAIHAEEYYYVQGIGFANQNIGYMGGTRGKTYETRDGGITWTPHANIGDGFNNFQFFESGMAYGVGFGVFKCQNVNSTNEAYNENYNETGNLKSVYNLANGKRNGMARTYHPNGKVASSGMYKDNLKTKKWQYFDEDGELLEVAKMKNGVAKFPSKKLKQIEGVYRAANGVNRKIFIQDGILHSQRENGNVLPIFPESASRFYYAFNPEITIQFFQDVEKNFIKAELFRNGTTTELKRVE